MTARQKAVEMWNRRQEDKREVKVLAPLSGCKEMNCPDYKDNMCQHNSPWCRYNTPVEGPMPNYEIVSLIEETMTEVEL